MVFSALRAASAAAGEIVLFDRSWYNRAGVERVMGFCTEEDCEEFFRSVPDFERMLVRSGIILIKYWFSITDEEQKIPHAHQGSAQAVEAHESQQQMTMMFGDWPLLASSR
jgi:polyphosphate kinase 2 (PPK2 family)